MEGKDELDRVIDRALAGYSDAEPVAGLEQRVLSRVRRAEGARRRVLGWALAFASVAAAALVVAVIVVRTTRHSDSKTYSVVVPAATRPAPPIEQPRVAPEHRTKPRALRPRRLPKQQQFPAPSPLTVEERALLAFVGHDAAEAQQVFAGLRKRSDEPIEIPAIKIPPLQIDGAQ